jgi:hypothetical protein
MGTRNKAVGATDNPLVGTSVADFINRVYVSTCKQMTQRQVTFEMKAVFYLYFNNHVSSAEKLLTCIQEAHSWRLDREPAGQCIQIGYEHFYHPSQFTVRLTTYETHNTEMLVYDNITTKTHCSKLRNV